MSKPVMVIWFSCGVASAVAAIQAIERYGRDYDIRIVNTPILEEDLDNRRFLRDVEQHLKRKIEISINPKYPFCSTVDVWERERFMLGPYGAPCTKQLKKNARHRWERLNKFDTFVLGFTADEQKRHERFIQSERDDMTPVLIEAGMSREDCNRLLEKIGIQRPRIYNMGFKNGNCRGCVKSRSPRYWNLVREHFPDVFTHRAIQSQRIGCKLVRIKGVMRQLSDLLPNNKESCDEDTDCDLFCKPEMYDAKTDL